MAAGRLLEEVTDPFTLEGHPPVQPEEGALGLPLLQVLHSASTSAYLEQVRRIAPPDPPGLMAGRRSWRSWPGSAWTRTGRRMRGGGPGRGRASRRCCPRSCCARPPRWRERVRIVSFFITARLAAQDTREAFTEVVLEQLAALLGQSLPAVLPEATREAYLLDLMCPGRRRVPGGGRAAGAGGRRAG